MTSGILIIFVVAAIVAVLAIYTTIIQGQEKIKAQAQQQAEINKLTLTLMQAQVKIDKLTQTMQNLVNEESNERN